MKIYLSDVQEPPTKRLKQGDGSFLEKESVEGTRSSKIRSTQLPQVYNLARLIRNITNPHVTWTTSVAARNWQGVSCDDKEQNVIKINWRAHLGGSLQGSLQLKYLPETVHTFDVAYNNLTSSIQLDTLPETLLLLDLSHNRFTGSLDLCHLPSHLKRIYLEKNNFENTVDLTALPGELERLILRGNNLLGEVDLSLLPSTLTNLSLGENEFSGTPDFRHLPSSLESLFLDNNNFKGCLYFKSLPVGLTWIDVSHNSYLRGEFDKTFLPGVYFERAGTDIRVIEPEAV